MELPSGCFLFYPSALFHHWNIDVKGELFDTAPPSPSHSLGSPPGLDAPGFFARVFATPGNEDPTADNMTPLNNEPEYRCSFVWFSQASMFQYTEGLDGKYDPNVEMPEQTSNTVFSTLG